MANEERVIGELKETVARLERKMDDLTRALYGYQDMGQKGFKAEMEKQVQENADDIQSVKKMCEALQEERAEERAERRGAEKSIKRIQAWTGVGSVATLIAVVAGLVAIYQAVSGG